MSNSAQTPDIWITQLEVPMNDANTERLQADHYLEFV